jgi:hypothetical protein
MMTTEVTVPYLENSPSSSSSVTESARFLTNTLVKRTSEPSGRSWRLTKGPTYTFLPSSSMPLTCMQDRSDGCGVDTPMDALHAVVTPHAA